MSILDDIIKAQSEVFENAKKIEQTKFTNSTKGTSGIFRYMKAKGIYFPNAKYFPSYHFVIRNPQFKYEYNTANCMTGKDGWYNKYQNLVLLYVDAEAFNIESIKDAIYPDFCEELGEWVNTLNKAVLSHFNPENTTEYDKFLKLFGNPVKLKMLRLGMNCPRKPTEDDIVYYDHDEETMEEIRQNLEKDWERTYYENSDRLREMYRHNYEISDFTKSDSISKPGGLIEAAKNWVNPYFNREEEIVDNGVKRCDSDGFHAVIPKKHAGGRPVKLANLQGASKDMVDAVLDNFGFSKQQKSYYRKRLGTEPTKKRGRPSKYSGMTEDQIREKMRSEGRSEHDIAKQIRRTKK